MENTEDKAELFRIAFEDAKAVLIEQIDVWGRSICKVIAAQNGFLDSDGSIVDADGSYVNFARRALLHAADMEVKRLQGDVQKFKPDPFSPITFN